MEHETTNQPLASTENLTVHQAAEGALVVVDQRSGQTTTYGDFAELADAVEAVPLDDEYKRLVVEVARVLGLRAQTGELARDPEYIAEVRRVQEDIRGPPSRS